MVCARGPQRCSASTLGDSVPVAGTAAANPGNPSFGCAPPLILRGRLRAPWRHLLFVFDRVAETFDIYSQPAQCIQRHQPPVRVERDDVSKHSAEGEGLWWLTESIHERVVPSIPVSYIAENTVEFSIRSLQAFQQG